MGWRDKAIPMDAPPAGGESWRGKAIPMDEEEQPVYTEEQRRADWLAAERERNLARAGQVLGESNLPSFKAGMIQTGAGIVSPVARVLGYSEYADRMNRLAGAVEQVQQEREAGGIVPDILKRGARGVGTSLATAVPAAAVAGPYGAIAAFSAQEANRAVTEGRDVGLKGVDLAGHVARTATIEAAPALIMQKIGMGGLESVVGGKRAVSSGLKAGLKQVGKDIAHEVPEELVTEIAHSVESAFSGVDPDALSAENIKRTVADTVVQTIGSVGAASGPRLVTAYQRDEILKLAKSGKPVSRTKWKALGIPGDVKKQADRKAGVKQAAKEIKADEQAVATQPAPVEVKKGVDPPVPPDQAQAPQAASVASLPVQPETTSAMPQVAPEQALGGVGKGAKEPWQMTKAEYRDQVSEPPGDGEWGVFKVGKATVARNPKDSDIREMTKKFKEENPHAPADTPKVRTTIDEQGNKYSWRADEKTHSEVEDAVKKKYGVAANQNRPDVEPHSYAVRRAVAAGKPVPAEVLSEYPAQATQEQATMGMAPAQHDFPVEMEGTGERVGAREVVRKLESIWGTTLRTGRMRSRGARGIYKPFAEVARLAKGEESSSAVQIHEAVGHHLDKTTDVLKSASAGAQAEVSQFDYKEDRKDRKTASKEGFAEFVRGYLTGGTELHKEGIDVVAEAPEFAAHFEQWLDANPEIRAKMEASREPLLAYRQAGAVGRVKGQVSKTGVDRGGPGSVVDRIVEGARRVYTLGKEEGRSVKRVTKIAEMLGYKPGKEDTTPFEDYNALRQIGPHFAATALEDGVFLLSGDMQQVSPSMKEVMSEIEEGDDYTNFVAWAYAQHAVESWGHKKNPGITLEDAKQTAQELYDPRYEKAAKGVTQFNDALLMVLADVGVIDVASFEKMVTAYQFYMPLERAKEGAKGGGGRRMVDLSAAVKGRRGSGLQIIDPIETTIARSIRLYERAAQQVVINNLIGVTESVEGLGEWVEEVPTKVIKENFSIDQIKGQLTEAFEQQTGTDISDLLKEIDPMTALSVWRPDLMKVHGQPIIRITRGGQPVFYQVHPDLVEALGGLETLQNLGISTKIARAFTGLMKRGATRMNPDFIISNAVRDYQTFLMQGEEGLKGAFDPAKYAAAYVMSELQHASGKKGDPVVEAFQKMGGELSTYAGLDRARLKASVKRAVRGKQGKFTTAANIVGTSEVAGRISEFAAILDKDGWLDRLKAGEQPPMSTLIHAINAAHDVTTDFRRMGKWGRYVNYYIPFFNARLEGLDKFIRTFKDHPARSSLRAVTNIVPLAMMYWWYRHDDDDYKERPRWQDGFFILKDEDGNPLWRIPKSHEWGLIESGVERMMDAMYDKDPEAMERWFEQAFKMANPAGMPAGITPVFEGLFNYDSFRDRPIVSDALLGLENRDQYYDYTSGIAKASSDMMFEVSNGAVSLSPAKLDHLANGLLGGLYGKVNTPIEHAISGDRWDVHDIPGMKGITLRKDYTKSVDDFYDQKEVLDKKHKSGQLRGEKAENENKRRKFGYVKTLMSEIRKASRGLPVEEKRQAGLALTGLARAALDREPLERYPNPLADMGAVSPAIRSVLRKHVATKTITASSKAGGKKAGNAARYLREMGVGPALASNLAYDRLRRQGVSQSSARARSGRSSSVTP